MLNLNCHIRNNQNLLKALGQINTAKLGCSQQHDREIWDAFRQGNPAAFQQIYQCFVQVLFSYGNKITTDFTLVEDCIHDLFIELWDRKEHLGDTTSVKLYLFKGLKRKIIRKQTRQKKTVFSESEQPYVFGITFSYESSLILEQLTEEQYHRLTVAIAKLTNRQREVLFLRFHANMSHEEIAHLLSLNYQSVSNLMFRAMKMLRKEMLASPAPSSFPLYAVLLLLLA